MRLTTPSAPCPYRRYCLTDPVGSSRAKRRNRSCARPLRIYTAISGVFEARSEETSVTVTVFALRPGSETPPAGAGRAYAFYDSWKQSPFRQLSRIHRFPSVPKPFPVPFFIAIRNTLIPWDSPELCTGFPCTCVQAATSKPPAKTQDVVNYWGLTTTASGLHYAGNTNTKRHTP